MSRSFRDHTYTLVFFRKLKTKRIYLNDILNNHEAGGWGREVTWEHYVFSLTPMGGSAVVALWARDCLTGANEGAVA